MAKIFSITRFRNGALRLLGLTSGEATLKAPAVAGTIEVTLPDSTSTLAGKDITQSFSKAQRASQSSLTSSAGSIAIDFSLNNDFTHTFTENTTLENPSNVVVGQSGFIYLTQHASSPKTLSFGSNYDFKDGTPFSVSSVNSARDTIGYNVRSATQIELNIIKAMS